MFVTKRKYNNLYNKLENTTKYYEDLLLTKATLVHDYETEKKNLESEVDDLQDQIKALDLQNEYLEEKIESIRQLLGYYPDELPESE